MYNNRLWNCKNPHQGLSLKTLCLCSAGLLRSPTIANVLHREFGYNTRAAGIDKGHALIIVDEVLIEWADIIVVVDELVLEDIKKSFDIGLKRVINLQIEDSYAYMDKELQEIILEKFNAAITRPS